jgi:hypothetical protein
VEITVASPPGGSVPLTPGVTYELWVVGHNFRGDGPESNRVRHTA